MNVRKFSLLSVIALGLCLSATSFARPREELLEAVQNSAKDIPQAQIPQVQIPQIIDELTPADDVEATLRAKANQACFFLKERFLTVEKSQECQGALQACADDLFKSINDAVGKSLKDCKGSINDIRECLAGNVVNVAIENERAKISEKLDAICLAKPAQENPNDNAGNNGNVGGQNDNIVAGQAEVAKGGCTVTGLGGAEGNLLWMVLGLVPMLGLRRKG